jgi:hypothetical protein
MFIHIPMFIPSPPFNGTNPSQVPPVGNRLFGQATLYDLQYYCVSPPLQYAFPTFLLLLPVISLTTSSPVFFLPLLLHPTFLFYSLAITYMNTAL